MKKTEATKTQIDPSNQEKRIQRRIEEVLSKYEGRTLDEDTLREMVSEGLRAGFDLLPAQKIIGICEAFRNGSSDGLFQFEAEEIYRLGSNEWKGYCFGYDVNFTKAKLMDSYLKEFQEKH